METPGNQVDKTAQEIGTLTLSEQGVESRDAGKTWFTEVEIGDARGTQPTGVETRDAVEAQQGHDRREEKHELTSGASGGEDNQLQEVKTGDAEETLLAGVKTGDREETLLAGVKTGDKEETQLAGVETGDTRETHQQGLARGGKEDEKISGSAGSKNNQLQEEDTGLVKLSAYSEAGAGPEQVLEQWPNDIKAMLRLVNDYVLFRLADGAMGVARDIKGNLLHKPKPPKVQDLMSEAERCEVAGKYTDQLILLWCACFLADDNKEHEVCAIVDCLERMNAAVIGTVHEVVRKTLGELLCLLSEDVEAMMETLDDLGADWLIKIRIRCLSNKAFGLAQQHNFSEAIQVYESCISKIRQCLGPNADNCVVLGEFLAMLGYCRFALNEDSPEGFENMKDARIIMRNASPTSAFEERIRAAVLETSKSTSEVQCRRGSTHFLQQMFRKRLKQSNDSFYVVST